jgi:hypothetical protein
MIVILGVILLSIVGIAAGMATGSVNVAVGMMQTFLGF